MSIYRQALEVLADNSHRPSLEIIFHGGEPLLESAEWYDDACRLAVEILSARGKSCEFGLQSNLTLLRDEHIDVFVRHRVKVGTSLDGPKDVHDAVRGRYEATVRNLRRLREAGVFSGAIAVLHHHNWDLVRDIYETFLSLDIRSFHLNVASAVGHGSGLLPLSEEQILRILRDDFECMRHYDGEIVETRLLDKIRRYVSPPATRDFLSQLKCDNPFCHAGINMVIFKANGEIYPCGCAGTSGNMRNFLLGNVQDDGLSTVLYSGQLRQFHAKTDKYERECRTCPARMVCEHGCPAFDMNDPVTPEHHCQATKRFEQYLAMQPRRDIERVAAFMPKSSGER